jgi:RAD51-like protein 2
MIIIFLSALQVRTVIIDSVTFHFRQDFDDLALRTRVLSGLSLKLMKLSKTYNLAVSLQRH